MVTVQGVLWDLDGTLVDSEPAHDAAFAAVLDEIGLDVPADFYASTLGASEDVIHASLVRGSGLTLSLAEWRAVKWRHFSHHAAGVTERAPLATVLRRLDARAVPMALVSNSTRDEVDLNLRITGLGPHLRATFSRDDVSRGKPEPEGYLAAARTLGLPPAACLVVEDSRRGIAAGVAAGMQCLFHPQTDHAPEDRPAGATYLPPHADPWPVFAAALGLRGDAA